MGSLGSLNEVPSSCCCSLRSSSELLSSSLIGTPVTSPRYFVLDPEVLDPEVPDPEVLDPAHFGRTIVAVTAL